MTKHNYDPQVIALWIKDLRLKKNLTQLQLAMELGVEERTVRRYETDGVYKIDVICNIANYFGADPYQILASAL